MSPETNIEKLRISFLAKTSRSELSILWLSIIGGMFIALGAAFMLLIKSDYANSFAVTSLMCGLAFSLGLFSIMCTGAELFTGDNLIFLTLNDSHNMKDVFRYFALVWGGNFIGSIFIAMMLYFSNFAALNHGNVGEMAITVANTKASLPIPEMFAKAVLCNFLVCLAVFIGSNANSLLDKFIAAVIPVSAFVACSFEHSIANQFFFSYGWLISIGTDSVLNFGACLLNLIIVTIGNMVGGIVVFCGAFFIASSKR